MLQRRLRGADDRRHLSSIRWAAGTALLAAVLGYAASSLTNDQFVKLLAVLIAVAVAANAWNRPHLGLLVVPALAVFDRTISFHGFSIGLAVAALAVYAPAMALSWRTWAIPRTVAAGIGMFLLGALIACFFTPDLPSAIGGAVTWALVLNYLLGGLAIIGARPDLLRTLAVEIAALGALVAALGWLQGHGHYTVVGPPYVADRVDSSFGWYSNYGNFVAIAAVIGLGASITLAQQHRGKTAIATGLCSVISAYGVLVSLSRGAVLCLVVGVAVILLGYMRSFKMFLGSVVLIGFALLVAWWLTPPATVTEFFSRFHTAQGGDTLRRVLQQAGKALLLQHPAGIGFGSFRDLAGTAFSVGTTVLAHCHSLFFQVGLDDGWLGLVGFLVLVVFACARGMLGAWTGRTLPYNLGFVAALVGALAQGVNDYFFFETASLVVLGVVLTGALAGRRPVASGDQAPVEASSSHRDSTSRQGAPTPS